MGRIIAVLLLMGIVLTGVATQGQQFSSNAAALAGSGGRIIGAGLVCRIDEGRLNRAGVRILESIGKLAQSAADKTQALNLYMDAGAISAQQQKAGRGEPCSSVHAAFGQMERTLGLR